MDPSSITLVKTRVTPLQYQNEDNQGAEVEAGIAGHFYNEGVSNMDYAGEVEAKIWIGGHWNGGGAIPAAHWWVRKFFDYEGTFSQILDQGTFVMPITLGDTYALFDGMGTNYFQNRGYGNRGFRRKNLCSRNEHKPTQYPLEMDRHVCL
jgi:hypothetical protein